MSIQIISTGSYLPELVVTNDDLSKFLDTNDEWITTRTGIKSRHIATKETTTDLGTKAAKIAFADSGLKAEDINLVICVTYTPDTCVPAVAANIKKGLGIEHAVAFDMHANCSGFIYGVTVAESMMKNCGYKHAIVVGVDLNSQVVDWKDRGTCVIFGDGAGAVVLSNTDKRGIIYSHLDCLIDPDNYLTCYKKIEKTPFSDFQQLGNTTLSMNGKEVMNFAIKALIETLDLVLEKAKITLDDIKWIIPHQANYKIIHFAAKRRKIDADKFYMNLERTGNTSSGSIPIALDEVVRNKQLNRGDLVLFVAFGGGLSYGGVLLEW
jgi:3-oxoacyl-[acyl-carrier-protein] synthase-3